MSRKSKIIALSLPPKLHRQFSDLARKNSQSKSELFRQMIKGCGDAKPAAGSPADSDDLASVLRAYWRLRQNSNAEIKLIALGIVSRPNGDVLIVSRRQRDERVPTLKWAFPGGEIHSLEFVGDFKAAIKAGTGLGIKNPVLVSSRLIPETRYSDTGVVALYFHCQTAGKPTLSLDKKKYEQSAWVKPADVFEKFSSSTSDEVVRFLIDLSN